MSGSSPDRSPWTAVGFGQWARLTFLAPVLLAAEVASASAAQAAILTDPEYVIETWEAENGLPENSATSIIQTPDGYLWFGTFNGLVRFNGVEFTVFNPANTPRLPSAAIVNLHLDGRGWLWISTYGGLVVRDGEEWRQWQTGEGWTGDMVRTFAERPGGDLLLTTFNGKLFEFSDGKFTELPLPPGEKAQGYFGGQDEDGHWWVVQNRFIGRWEGGRWVSMISPPAVSPDAVGCGAARDGGMWLLLGDELRKLRRDVEVVRLTLRESPGGVWSLSEDSQGNVWIATYDQGICRVATNGTMLRWDGAGGVSDRGRCVFEDREMNLWLGTSGDGLMRFTPRRFKHFELAAGRKGPAVQSVWPDAAGGLWAATYGSGLAQVTESGATSVVLPGATGGSPYLQSVLRDRSGRLWIGTLGRALWLWEREDARQVPPEQIGGDNVIALFEDSRGGVWVSGGRGAARLGGRDFTQFGPDQGLPPGGVTCFAEDASGTIWLSNGTGVFRRHQDERFAEVKDADGKSIRGITCLEADAGGAMWLGSADRGLLRWKQGQLVVLDAQVGFPVSAVQSLIEDQDAFLWMTSGHRIVRARRNDLHAWADGQRGRHAYQVFDASDGLPHAVFSTGRQPACARDERGRLWFATSRGVVMTDPAAFRLNREPPMVHVEGISFRQPASLAGSGTASGRGVGDVPSQFRRPFAGRVSLPAGSRSIEIYYAGLSLAAPEKVRYEIKLEGPASDWLDAGNRRVAYYHELPPGEHVFRVRAANSDGVWNETGASLAFTVLPHYWQTLWFRAFGVLAMGAGLVVVYRRRIARLEKRRVAQETFARQLLAAQETERARLARELHDDITQRLARLAIDVGRCELGTSGVSPAETVRDVRQGLVQLSEDVHALSYRLHPSILEDLGLVAALRAESEHFTRQESVPVDVKSHEIPEVIPSGAALCLFRVAQEGLRNVARHAHARVVEISLRGLDGGLQLAVRDDGAGFDPAVDRDRPSLGLASMRERVRSLGGELDIESAPGQGTTIMAWVPFRQG